MDSLSPQVVSAAKLPILSPNEFDLWKMRIEQYFLMTDYSLWEVILNGDSSVPTRVVEGVLQPVAPITAEQKLDRKNALKAPGTLLMALPDKHQLKFNSHKDAKTPMEAIKKRFKGNTETKKVQKTLLKQQYENFTDVNLKFLRSLPSEWKTHTLIWRNKADLEEQSLDDLFNSLKIYETEVKHSSSTGRNLGANGPTSMGFDMSKVECYNCHRKRHFARECRSSKDSRRTGAAEPQRRTVPVETSTSNALVFQCLESIEVRLLVYKQNEYVFEENIKLLNIKVQLKDTTLFTLRQKLEKAEQERDDLKLKLEKFQTSSKNLTELLASQINEKTGLGYNSQVFTQAMFDCDDYFSLESDCESWPHSSLYDRFQLNGGYHVVPPPYTGTFMPPKPDLPVETSILAATPTPANPKSASSGRKRNGKACFVCKSVDHLIKDCDYHAKIMAQPTLRNYAHRGNHKQYAPLTHTNPQKHMVPTAVLTQSKPVFNTAVKPVSAAMPKINVTRPRYAHPVVTKSKSLIRRHITCSPSPKTSNLPPRVTVVQAPVDKRVIDSGCSRNMTGNMSYLSDFEELNGGYVTFGGNPKGGKISSKGKIKTGKLDFDDVYFVKELKFNFFSVSQMCDKKNSVLFTDTKCLVLSPNFKLPDASQVLLRVPEENNMYNVNLKNIVPSGDLTCLFAKATIDESNLWHRRLGHINFKTINKLVKGNRVRGLPTKGFENVNTCVACKKGKQHRAFYKTKPDETSPILKTFITGLENQLSLKVKVIRSDNGTEFKNNDLNQFCGIKGIKREFSVPRTPQQNGIAERKNMTLIEAARTMLVDSLLPIPFWVEAVNTACYVQNRVLVTKPHNTTPYKLLHGRTPSICFMRPFGCPVTILNTLDPLGKFEGKVDEGFLVGYSNNDEDVAFDGKEHDFDAKKPESEVNVSSSNSVQLRKQDDKTKKEAKGK
nr:hypothetical protein [Tanacetum cinerariifolium]